MAFAIASLLWLAAFAAAGITTTTYQASVGQGMAMQLHESSDPGLANSASLPPASQWRLGFEQGRRLEGATHTERYQMVLAWFQHDILGLLSGLLSFVPLIYVRQACGHVGYLHKRQLCGHHLQFRFCHGD